MRREIELYTEDLAQKPNILGIALFGSVARGDDRPDSDVDLFIVTDGLERRVAEKIGNLNFEITYTTEQGARTFATRRMDSFLNLWKDAQVLFDRDGVMERLRDFAAETREAGKLALSSEKQKHTAFDIQDSLRAIETLMQTDSATAEMYLQHKMYGLLQFYFDKNRIWIPPTKKQLIWLRENDVPRAQKFDAFYAATTPEDRLRLARELVTDITA